VRKIDICQIGTVGERECLHTGYAALLAIANAWILARTPTMTAGRRPDDNSLDAVESVSTARRALKLESEAAVLRTDNATLREQLALRDHALDATSTFFVIAQFTAPEPLIVYCNKVVADQHGFDREELIGQPVRILTQWVGGNANYASDVAAALRAGHTFHYEDEVTCRDGSTFWLGVAIRPIFDSTGRLTHSVAVGADITAKRMEAHKKEELQHKLLEEMKERERMVIELQLAQKLESVGRLAAGIAHEINTPIQYVGDSVHFLRSAYDDFNHLLDSWREAIDSLPDPSVRAALRLQIAESMKKSDMDFLSTQMPKAFDRIFDGVERVTNIVKAMKEFAHPDAKEQTPSDLNRALQTTLLVASNEYKYLATVHTDLADLPHIVCNIGELNQVFLNLIVNAAHAIHDAGKDVSTGEIKISTALVGDAAVIRISDNGCGVPAENLSKLYDPFFTTKEVGRGTGQGLAITHSILVDKHGGDISVQSSVGVGTEFTLRLPVGGRAARASI
jgi:PAS domain S-box-containing protein